VNVKLSLGGAPAIRSAAQDDQDARVSHDGKAEQWPAVSGAKPLQHELAGKFRLRTGDYRLQFHVEGEEIVVERIGHRAGFYEE